MPEDPDAFEYRFGILKRELDTIDSSIRKIDEIGNSIKNWAILAWTGSGAAILGKPELHDYVLFTAAPPLIFMFVDAHWRKVQRRFMWRQYQISDYLNSSKFDEDCEARKLNFHLFDPIARRSHKDEKFQKFISIPKILSFPTVSLVYLGLACLSIVLWVILLVAPPTKAEQ